VSFAVDRDRAGNRRRRITRRGHACHRVKKTWTVIRHARDFGLPDALAAGTLVVAMIESPLVGGPVTSARRPLRPSARGQPARPSAEPVPAIARSTDAEHELAQRTSLEAKLLVVVHQLLAR
jgi:hypothetical protein